MKRLSLILLLLITVLSSSFAQDSIIKDEYKTDLTYVNLPIYRIYDQRQAYIVMYQKNGNEIGQTILPKVWFKKNTEEPRKGIVRTLPKLLTPYLTVMYKGGEFYRVLINAPLSRNHSVWSVINKEINEDSINTETIQIEY